MKKEIKQQHKDARRAGRMGARGISWTETPISKYYNGGVSNKKLQKLWDMELTSYRRAKNGKNK